MYSGVPTAIPFGVRVPTVTSWRSPPAAMPKSVSNTRPSSASRMLEGLTSRWTISFTWQAVSANSTFLPMCATWTGGSGPYRATACASVFPMTSSMTIHGRPSSSKTSKILTMFELLATDSPCSASSHALLKCDLLSASPLIVSRRISLRATSWPDSSSWASQTCPMPPVPRSRRKR